MKISYLPLLMMLTATIACSKEKDDSAEVEGEKILHNESYGNHSRQVYDAYLPENRSTGETYSLIMVHGGSWLSGDKSELSEYLNTLRQRLPGVAFFNVNYRYALAESDKFPAQEKDIQAAVNHILSKKSEYQINGKYAVAGFSAGGHLALLQAYKNYGSNKPEAVISVAGPVDLKLLFEDYSNLATTLILATVTGTDPESNPELYRESSPVTYVKDGIPPSLILQGDQDDVVPVGQALLIKGLLENLGPEHKVVIYPGAGHTFYGTNITSALDEIVEFLNKHLK